MSDENNLDPCGDAPVQPSGSGEPVQPEPEGFDFDLPVYPEVETLFPNIPTARECIIVPRHLYYNHDKFKIDYFVRRTERESRRPINTVNSPLPLDDVDPIRFILGNVYDFSKHRNQNYFVNPGLNARESEKVDFLLAPLIRYDQAPGKFWESMSLQIKMAQAEVLFPREEFPLNRDRSGLIPSQMGYPTIVDFYKSLFVNSSLFRDDSFKAPAAFFAKEADGLNLRLPNVASAQTFIPNMLTYSDTRADYGNLYEEEEMDPRLKKSVYERYSQEFDQREQQCSEGEFVKVHKYPSAQVKKLNQITEYAIPSNPAQHLSSFQRIFKSEYKFYNKISFDTSHQSAVAEKIKELDLDSLVLGILDTESPSKPYIYTQFLDEKIESYTGLSDNDGVSENVRLNTYEDGLKLLQKYIDTNHPLNYRDRMPLVLDPATYPLSFENEDWWREEYQQHHVDGRNLSLFSLSRWASISMLMGWLDGHIQATSKNYKDLSGGDINHSEIIAYRLEKRDAATGEVLQNFYFFNDPDTDRISFIDTQISFGQRYRYSIHTINFVNYLQYSYKFPQQDINWPFNDINWNNEVLRLRIRVDQDTTGHSIIESPYFQQELLVSDAPPLPPDVTFLPWETISENLAFFWFTPRLGELYENPISILESDNETIERMRQAQNVGVYRNQEIYYKSDSDPTHYQMMVLEEPPLSYQDFLNAHFEEATIESPTLLVRFQPNRDYYMTFRARDLGGISNPTKVFRYRINSFGDGIEHEIAEYSFAETRAQRMIQFDQAIEVSPSAEQRAVNFSNSEEYSEHENDLPTLLETTRGLNGLSLGVADEEIWNKTFVFEVVSAETGKSIRVEATWKQIVESQYEINTSEQDDQNAEASRQTRAQLTGQCMVDQRNRQYLQNKDSSDTRVSKMLESRNLETGRDPQPSRGDLAERVLSRQRSDAEERNNDSGDY